MLLTGVDGGHQGGLSEVKIPHSLFKVFVIKKETKKSMTLYRRFEDSIGSEVLLETDHSTVLLCEDFSRKTRSCRLPTDLFIGTELLL